jgi:hypothetical protein
MSLKEIRELMSMRKIPKSRIVWGIVLVLVVVGFVIWNASVRTTEEISITTITTTTIPITTTTTISEVSFMTAQAGGTGSDIGRGVAVTSDGGAIVTGEFTDTVIFGSTTLTSNGEEDVFVGKISSAGVWVWATQTGGTGSDIGQGVSVTPDGGAIIIGQFEDTATFGSTILNSNGVQDVFVGKVSSAGVWVWATQTGGTGSDIGQGVAATSDGGAIVTGSFRGAATFGSTTLTSNGARDVFVGKVSSAGVWVWATQTGGSVYGYNDGRGVAVTSDGGAIITGSFYGTAEETVTFGSTALTSDGYYWDVFVGKVSSAGVWVWANKAGGHVNEGDTGFAVSVTSDGGAIITGEFSGKVTFGSTTLTSNGDADMFVGKISPTGVWVWVTQTGGTSEVGGNGVAATSDGGAIITGGFVGSVTFGSTTLISNGDADMFVGKISSAGVWVWATQTGGIGDDFGLGVAVTSDGGAIITGGFTGKTTFGSATLTSSGDRDVFVAKISSAGVWES